MAHVYRNARAAIGSPGPTTIYTCPVGKVALVFGLNFANVDGVNEATLSAEVFDSSASLATRLYHQVPLPARSSLEHEKTIVLEANDVLRASAGAASDIEAHASILEIG